MMVAKIEPLAGPSSIPSVEMEGPKLQVQGVTIHWVPPGMSVDSNVRTRDLCIGRHGRRSGCEKMKSGLMGNPMP